jgi:PadR family transcriptional regulator, regulatory protein PadR
MARKLKRPGPRMTIPTQLVLCALLTDPTQEMYGLQICEAAGLPSGTIHPILARLEHEYGWVTSRWEDIKPEAEGRPRRRYYQLTKDGAERARLALAQATTSVSTIRLRTRAAGGLA